ncbi:hypothetical protein Q4F19_02600 [Sphingomonas sp. BIUV-7]|uniref:DUF2975 domain-containing protein n=2 Tax=Sphingomonas natans TaxID=3063330 RepID=A0ABT8Y4K9_9SPHN|nr:hypothetical protein [Sphingomonas sp. BIUV-7]
MLDTYSLSPRRARIVRLAAALFLLVGLVSLVGTAVSMARPALSVRCGAAGCTGRTPLIDLAPEDARPALAASRTAQAAFAHHVARPIVRAGLAATQLIRGLPFAALMLAVGLALRRLAARVGDDLAQALPWLRRAALAALVAAIAPPVTDSLSAMILFPGTPSGAMWYLEVDFLRLACDLLLALAAVAVAWAIDAGGRAERDVASFV